MIHASVNVNSTNWKHQGSKNELLFMTECMKRGWKVSMPFGDDSKYDVVVDTPSGLRRVQVKSCHQADQRGRFRINLKHGAATKKRYTSADCDIVAAYITPLNHWFFVPVDQIATSQLDLAHHHHDCLEAWTNIHDPSPNRK